MTNSGSRRVLGSSWVDETEIEVDRLRDIRAELRGRLHELDIEGEEIWELQEQRWRRLESKLEKLANRSSIGVNLGLATNIENLIAEIDEAYTDLDDILG